MVLGFSTFIDIIPLLEPVSHLKDIGVSGIITSPSNSNGISVLVDTTKVSWCVWWEGVRVLQDKLEHHLGWQRDTKLVSCSDGGSVVLYMISWEVKSQLVHVKAF